MTTTADTLALLKEAQANPDPRLAKAITQATGLVAFDLQAGAKQLIPVITPLRNMIPRVPGAGGTATNWKSVTGININGLALGVSEGNRSGVIATSVTSNMAAYKGLGLEDNVSFEADYAAQGFDDAKAIAAQNLLRSVMIGEEKLIVGGNTSLALGQSPTPTLVALGSGGTLLNAAYNVYCVALAFDGFVNSSVANGVPTSVTRTNADGTSDTYGGGSARISAAANITPAANGSIQASVPPVRGAVAYAWFWGTGGAPNEKLGAITTINSVLITAAPAGSQLAGTAGLASDNSQNALVFDGLISQVANPTSNAYWQTLATGTPGVGSTLTADGAGGVVEVDAALKSFWDNFRLSPDLILVSSQEMMNIAKKVLSGSGASLFRFNLDNGGGAVNAGAVVGNYLNRYTMDGGQLVKVLLHPNVPAGTILFYSRTIPYPLSNVSNVLQMKTRREYYQIEWPLKARRYEYGVYVDEVLQNYFPPAFGMLTNIANG
jgi:hypothetical protein